MERPGKRINLGNNRDINRFYWLSTIARPNDSLGNYRGIGGRNTVFGNFTHTFNEILEEDFEPSAIPVASAAFNRDQSIRLNHIKIDAVVQPVDSCYENGKPSNFPGTLHWCLFVHRPPNTPPFPAIFPASAVPSPDVAGAYTWSYNYADVPEKLDPKSVIDFGVMAINPQRQWGAQTISYDPSVYEVNETTVDGTTEGTLTPIPPVASVSFNGWYAGGSDTSGKICVDKNLDGLIMHKNCLLVLEYRLECERIYPTWFIENITGNENYTQLAVKVNGACSVDYTVN